MNLDAREAALGLLSMGHGHATGTGSGAYTNNVNISGYGSQHHEQQQQHQVQQQPEQQRRRTMGLDLGYDERRKGKGKEVDVEMEADYYSMRASSSTRLSLGLKSTSASGSPSTSTIGLSSTISLPKAGLSVSSTNGSTSMSKGRAMTPDNRSLTPNASASGSGTGSGTGSAATSSATLNSILGTTMVAPLIPAKRKVDNAELERMDIGREKGRTMDVEIGRVVDKEREREREIERDRSMMEREMQEREMMRSPTMRTVYRELFAKPSVQPPSPPSASKTAIAGQDTYFERQQQQQSRRRSLTPTRTTTRSGYQMQNAEYASTPNETSIRLDPKDSNGNDYVLQTTSHTTANIGLRNSTAKITVSSNADNSNNADISSEPIDCMCGSSLDDGFSIACDKCGRWCHGLCFGIRQEGVPDVFLCWVCSPRSEAIIERARALQREQKEKLRLTDVSVVSTDSGGGGLAGDDAKGQGHRRRQLSPGTERKGGRRGNSSLVEGGGVGGKRKRRSSIAQHANASTPTSATATLSTPNGHTGGLDDDHIDVDEPWAQSYIHINEDIIPSDETRLKLRRQAQHWRGITAINSDPHSAPITIKQLPLQSVYDPLFSLNSNPQVLPPTYGIHTTQPIPSDKLITPYTSSIMPSSSYLADPLNAYAHLGMPKPFVHLVGPPLDVALDARLVGNHGRFVRNGCRPNAVLRPVLCNKGKAKAKASRVSREGDTDDQPDKGKGKSRNKDDDDDDDGRMLAFGVFALRDLKENEEVVLGWEWDDGHAIHRLPALLQAVDMFPPTLPNGPSHTPLSSLLSRQESEELELLRRQMTNVLHALSSTFTTCACGAKTKDCAFTQMARFVDGQEGYLRRYKGLQMYNGNHSHDDERGNHSHLPDLGPLIGKKRGFRTKERIPFSGGIGGVEMVVNPQNADGPHIEEREKEDASATARGRGKGRGRQVNVNGSNGANGHVPLPSVLFQTSPTQEAVGKSKVSGRGKGKQRAGEDEVEMDGPTPITMAASSRPTHQSQAQTPDYLSPTLKSKIVRSSLQDTRQPSSLIQPKPPDPPPTPAPPDLINEDRMPPKMRKRWMHREVEALKESSVGMSGTGTTMTEGGSRVNVESELKFKSAGDGVTSGGLGLFSGLPTGSTEKVGLGIRFGDSTSMPPPPLPTSAFVSTSMSRAVVLSPKIDSMPDGQLHHLRPEQEEQQQYQLLTPVPTPSLSSTSASQTAFYVSPASMSVSAPPPTSNSSTLLTPPSGSPQSQFTPRSPPPISGASTASGSTGSSVNAIFTPATPFISTSTPATVMPPTRSPTAASASGVGGTGVAVAAAPSPLVGFSNLSLLSPALFDRPNINSYDNIHMTSVAIPGNAVVHQRLEDEDVYPYSSPKVAQSTSWGPLKRLGSDMTGENPDRDEVEVESVGPSTKLAREIPLPGSALTAPASLNLSSNPTRLAISRLLLAVEEVGRQEKEMEQERMQVEDHEKPHLDPILPAPRAESVTEPAREAGNLGFVRDRTGTYDIMSTGHEPLVSIPSSFSRTRSRSTSIASSVMTAKEPEPEVKSPTLEKGDAIEDEDVIMEEARGKEVALHGEDQQRHDLKGQLKEEQGILKEDAQMEMKRKAGDDMEMDTSTYPILSPPTGAAPKLKTDIVVDNEEDGELRLEEERNRDESVTSVMSPKAGREDREGNKFNDIASTEEHEDAVTHSFSIDTPQPSMSIVNNAQLTSSQVHIDTDVHGYAQSAMESPEPPFTPSVNITSPDNELTASPSTPAAPTKVKLSFKDFLARKRKNKEKEKEQEGMSVGSAQASPMSAVGLLPGDMDGEVEVGHGHVQDEVQVQTAGVGADKHDADNEKEELRENKNDDTCTMALGDVSVNLHVHVQPSTEHSSTASTPSMPMRPLVNEEKKDDGAGAISMSTSITKLTTVTTIPHITPMPVEFGRSAFSAAAAAISHGYHRPPPIPVLPPSSPLINPVLNLFPSSPPFQSLSSPPHDEDEIMKSPTTESPVIETKEAKQELIEEVVPPKPVHETPPPGEEEDEEEEEEEGKEKKTLPSLLSQTQTPLKQLWSSAAIPTRPLLQQSQQREDGEIELEVGEVRASSATPAASAFSSSPPPPVTPNPLPLSRRIHPLPSLPSRNVSPYSPSSYTPSSRTYPPYYDSRSPTVPSASQSHTTSSQSQPTSYQPPASFSPPTGPRSHFGPSAAVNRDKDNLPAPPTAPRALRMKDQSQQRPSPAVALPLTNGNSGSRYFPSGPRTSMEHDSHTHREREPIPLRDRLGERDSRDRDDDRYPTTRRPPRYDVRDRDDRDWESGSRRMPRYMPPRRGAWR